jgi:sugar phosphate permease
MAHNTYNVGVAAVALGAVVFVIATGDIIFRVLGVLLSVVLINYGFQCMGKPPIFVTVQNWFDQIRKS